MTTKSTNETTEEWIRGINLTTLTTINTTANTTSFYFPTKCAEMDESAAVQDTNFIFSELYFISTRKCRNFQISHFFNFSKEIITFYSFLQEVPLLGASSGL